MCRAFQPLPSVNLEIFYGEGEFQATGLNSSLDRQLLRISTTRIRGRGLRIGLRQKDGREVDVSNRATNDEVRYS